jgi:hypothetical protein
MVNGLLCSGSHKLINNDMELGLYKHYKGNIIRSDWHC